MHASFSLSLSSLYAIDLLILHVPCQARHMIFQSLPAMRKPHELVSMPSQDANLQPPLGFTYPACLFE